MMKKILIVEILLLSTSLLLYAQPDSKTLSQNVSTIQQEVEQHKQDIRGLVSRVNGHQISINQQRNVLSSMDTKVSKLEKVIDSLNSIIIISQENIDSLELGLMETGQQAETKISELGGDVEKNRLYWIIATLVTLLLGALMYLFLGKRIKSSQTDVETQIKNTKKSLEEESLKLDNKLIEVLETQLKIKQEESKSQPIATDEKADHSLALKVADEIVRMQKNISRMDADIKGLKPLEKGIERIQANFAANGYEMVNLLNNEYDERMNIDVINFVDDDTLESGKKIISKIIKPQVNFNGILIQRAQVEVSQN